MFRSPTQHEAISVATASTLTQCMSNTKLVTAKDLKDALRQDLDRGVGPQCGRSAAEPRHTKFSSPPSALMLRYAQRYTRMPRVTVILTDEQYAQVRSKAGLIPLSAWFRDLGLNAGLTVEDLRRELHEVPPGALKDVPPKKHGKHFMDTW